MPRMPFHMAKGAADGGAMSRRSSGKVMHDAGKPVRLLDPGGLNEWSRRRRTIVEQPTGIRAQRPLRGL